MPTKELYGDFAEEDSTEDKVQMLSALKAFCNGWEDKSLNGRG